MWIFYAFLSAVFAALVAIFGKLGLKGVDPTLATTIRSIIMAMFLVCASFAFRKFQGFSLSSLSGKDWGLIALAGVAGALSWLFYFVALKSGVVSKVAAIDRLSVVFVVIFAAVFLGETMGWKTVVGVLFMLAGAILMII